jgi:acetyl-CoA carboxylase biotin carboxyl carrier protein
MDVDKIFNLIDKAEASSFDRIEIQVQDVKLYLERNRPGTVASVRACRTRIHSVKRKLRGQDHMTEGIIFAPIIRCILRSPGAGRGPYVREGQLVRKGETICIIEAMKMMNEVGAPKSGVIERIFAENAQAISEGDALFQYAKES